MRGRANTIRDFWLRVDKSAENGCWEWRGTRFRTGYGHFRYSGKTWYAHRLAWAVTHGNIPAGVLVFHSCDNRLCCNPEHLWIGNHGDVVAIRKQKQ